MSDLNRFGNKAFSDLNLTHYADDKDKHFLKKMISVSPDMFAAVIVLSILFVSSMLILIGTKMNSDAVFAATIVIFISLVLFWIRREFKIETAANNAHQNFFDTVESTYGTLKSPYGVVIGGLHSVTIAGKEKFVYLTLADDNITPLLVDEERNTLLPPVGHGAKINESNVIDESFTEVFVK